MSVARLLRLSALGAAVALVAACSDDPSGPRLPGNGRFQLALSGDYSANHNGDAVFGADGPQGARFFAVLLGTEESDLANLLFLRAGDARLEVGTHEVANTGDQTPDDEDAIEVLLGIGNSTSPVVGIFDGKSGSVTVTRSTADVVAGTFDIVAEGFLERDGEEQAERATVRVTGAFTAEAANGPSLQGARVRTRDVRIQMVRPAGR